MTPNSENAKSQESEYFEKTEGILYGADFKGHINPFFRKYTYDMKLLFLCRRIFQFLYQEKFFLFFFSYLL